ncbi:MAG: isochorismatase family cysteine hydrolase [Pseudomonadota bacterium]|nr:isochorismatase family cysteine hydrolase [Pseudomonadota bacterium]
MSSALVIIDMQHDFVMPGAPFTVRGAQASVPALRRLLDGCRERAVPVCHVTRSYRADGADVEGFRLPAFRHRPGVVAGTPGCQIIPELQPLPGEYQIVKPRFSAFMGTSLDLLLRRLVVNRLLICGTQYPNCIRATVMDAVALDYEVTLVTEATSAQTQEVAAGNLTDLSAIGVRCVGVAEALQRLDASER